MCVQEQILRGDLFWVDFGNTYENQKSSRQKGIRPAVIVQNNKGNYYNTTVIVAAITSQIKKLNQPTHVEVGEADGLEKPSVILLEQLYTIDKKDLLDKIGSLPRDKMKKIDIALAISGGIDIQNLTQNNLDIEHLKNLIWIANDYIKRMNKFQNNEWYTRAKEASIKELQYYCESCGIDYERKIKKYIINYKNEDLGLINYEKVLCSM